MRARECGYFTHVVCRCNFNDIATNLQDPPSFTAAAQLEENLGRDMSYPEDFAPQVEQGYPDLAPIRLELGKDESYARALAAAGELGWEITFQDSQAGIFEARSESRALCPGASTSA